VGLSAACELVRAGAEVKVFEKAGVASAQSKGLTRIFRHGHGDPHLVELAMRAGDGWRAWERHFGRRLIGNEGIIISGEEIVAQWGAAMEEAGAPNQHLSARECRDMLPIAAVPAGPALLDPGGGATRVRRTTDLLRSVVEHCLVFSEVTALEHAGGGARVETDVDSWQCDQVIVAAGIDTFSLARPLGLELRADLFMHSRFTFEVLPQYRDRRLSCWIDDSGLIGGGLRAYAQPVGSTGRYAVGVHREGQDLRPEVGADAERALSRQIASQYVSEALPGVHPHPVDQIQCTYPEFPGMNHGDGFHACRAGAIVVFYGNNLFKFAPLLGELLRDAALTGALPSELISPALTHADRSAS
jgi:sarcosine oxidase